MLLPVNKAEEEQNAAVMAEMEQYCDEYPRSPAAVRRPRIMVRGRSFVALLGSTLEDGTAGIGTSVRTALRAFDIQYSDALKEPRA